MKKTLQTIREVFLPISIGVSIALLLFYFLLDLVAPVEDPTQKLILSLMGLVPLGIISHIVSMKIHNAIISRKTN